MSELMVQALEGIADVLALAGALFFLISAIGLLRLPDFYCRIHAPTKAASLGVILLGLSSVLRSLEQGSLVWLEDLAIIFFLFLTVPVSSQVLARAASRRRIERYEPEPEARGRKATSPGDAGARDGQDEGFPVARNPPASGAGRSPHRRRS